VCSSPRAVTAEPTRHSKNSPRRHKGVSGPQRGAGYGVARPSNALATAHAAVDWAPLIRPQSTEPGGVRHDRSSQSNLRSRHHSCRRLRQIGASRPRRHSRAPRPSACRLHALPNRSSPSRLLRRQLQRPASGSPLAVALVAARGALQGGGRIVKKPDDVLAQSLEFRCI
jgi:hypothetical protein